MRHALLEYRSDQIRYGAGCLLAEMILTYLEDGCWDKECLYSLEDPGSLING